MKVLIGIIIFGGLLCGVVWLATNLRERKGEDIQVLTDAERDEVVTSIRYARDPRTGLCFAILAQNTDGFRTTFSVANVPSDVCGNQ